MRRRRRSSDQVELNLAAMLDMAFQLLAFFILTFRPAAVEVELRMNLPLQTGVAVYRETKSETPINETDSDAPAIYEAIPVEVAATPDGRIASIRLGLRTIATAPVTEAAIQMLGGEVGRLVSQPFAVDRVEISVAGNLSYQEFVRVVGVCSQQKLANGEPLQNIGFRVERKTP